MKRDYGNALLIAAIAVGAPRWAGAMLAADIGEVTGNVSTLLNGLNIISGLAMGPLEVLAMAYMFDGLRKQRPTYSQRGRTKINWKWWGVLFFALGSLALTPAILAPFIVSRMNNVGMVGVLTAATWQFLWSIVLTLAPIFVVGGVAFARTGLVSVVATSQVASKTKQQYPRKCEAEGCDYVANDRFAWSAHQKKHVRRE